MSGTFIISLDFELAWGVRDREKKAFEAYQRNLLGVWRTIPALLDIFDEYDIKATFATVGFLFAKNREDLLSSLPSVLPHYENQAYNPYRQLDETLGNDHSDDATHFAWPLIENIATRGHEIGTHTFSHYYCLESGQTAENFEADLVAAQAIARRRGIALRSIIFPRNQINSGYLPICEKLGILVYRGNQAHWAYESARREHESWRRRLFRFIDTYVDLSGHNTYSLDRRSHPLNVPASRFLRPYSRILSPFDPLRLRRIKNEMTYGAKNDRVYHLWWHPHNFGTNLNENMQLLRKICEHFRFLKGEFGFENATMQKLQVTGHHRHGQ